MAGKESSRKNYKKENVKNPNTGVFSYLTRKEEKTDALDKAFSHRKKQDKGKKKDRKGD